MTQMSLSDRDRLPENRPVAARGDGQGDGVGGRGQQVRAFTSRTEQENPTDSAVCD